MADLWLRRVLLIRWPWINQDGFAERCFCALAERLASREGTARPSVTVIKYRFCQETHKPPSWQLPWVIEVICYVVFSGNLKSLLERQCWDPFKSTGWFTVSSCLCQKASKESGGQNVIYPLTPSLNQSNQQLPAFKILRARSLCQIWDTVQDFKCEMYSLA